jgi:hypothetical protein
MPYKSNNYSPGSGEQLMYIYNSIMEITRQPDRCTRSITRKEHPKRFISFSVGWMSEHGAFFPELVFINLSLFTRAGVGQAFALDQRDKT